MKTPHPGQLGRRERQIMDAIHRLERAGVSDVLAELPDPPSYSSVRAMLRILESKGYLKHEQDGARYVYLPTAARATAQRSMLRHVVDTFFSGSTAQAAATLLESSDANLTEKDLTRLSRLIREARRQGR